MSFKSGFGSNAKVTKYRLSPVEGEGALYRLTPRQVKALLSNTDYISWPNRHESFPSDINTKDKLEAWVSDLNLALMTPIAIDCDFLKDCLLDLLANDQDILNQLIDTLTNSQEFKDRLKGGATTSPGGPTVTSTNLDALFGAITFLVDTLHDAIVDFNEETESSSNKRELGQILFEAIPLLETLPFDEFSEYADALYEDIVEVFNTYWTTTPVTGTRDIMRCGLFCLAKESGTLTWGMIQNYFFSKVSFSVGGAIEFIRDFMSFLVDGNWTGTQVVDISFANAVAALQAGQKYGVIDFPSIETIMKLGLNNPDPDWEILCPDCAVETPNLDIVNADPGTYPSTIVFVGHPEGHVERDIWTVTSVQALTNSAYVGYLFKDSLNRCMKIVSYTAPSSECLAADIECNGSYLDEGTSHPTNDEALMISGNTRLPSTPNEGTIGSVFTFVLEIVS